MSNPTDRVEIITSVQRRRRWTASEKVRELNDVREVPLIHVRSDLEFAAGHAYIAEGRNMA